MTATTEIRTKEGDWNQKFQKLVDELRNPKAETKSLFVELSHLGNEFLYAAQVNFYQLKKENFLSGG
jgi:hypothetical protein